MSPTRLNNTVERTPGWRQEFEVRDGRIEVPAAVLKIMIIDTVEVVPFTVVLGEEGAIGIADDEAFWGIESASRAWFSGVSTTVGEE